MRRISGRLQEAVAYESQTAGGLLQGKVQAHQLFVECSACNFMLQYKL